MRITQSIDVSSSEGLLRGAMQNGAVTDIRTGTAGGLSVDAEMHGRCQNPIEISRSWRNTDPDGERSERHGWKSGAETRALNITLRCRNCTTCLQARARKWREAATREMLLASGRSWFGTLTLSAEEQAKAGYAAMSRYGVHSFGELTAEEQLPLRHQAVQRSFTLALKRLRKRYGAGSFRYLLVCEAHKSGLPHYHMLLHEVRVETPIRKSALNDFWPLGFSQWRLAEPKAAGYVAKYLSKDARARVRASQHYGSGVHGTAYAFGSIGDGAPTCHSPFPFVSEGDALRYGDAVAAQQLRKSENSTQLEEEV